VATKTRLQVAVELLSQGRLAEARTRLIKELRLTPQSAQALELLGIAAFEMGNYEEAIGHLRRAGQLASSSPGPRLNLGKALLQAGRTDEAAVILEEAVRRWPQIAEGHHSLGNALLGQGKPAEAAEAYNAAIRLAPTNPGPYANLALALSDLHEHEASCEVCERLLALDPNSGAGAYLLARNRQMLCAWDGYEAHLDRFAKLIERGYAELGMALASMRFWDNAELHRRCAELALRDRTAGRKTPPAPKLTARKSGRIRVGYASADFRAHPTTWLIAGLIEGHDRERFEIVGISYGEDDNSDERHRMARAFDRFIDVREQSPDAVVRAMRGMEIDIAVDLMGHTRDALSELFLHRVAPVQVSYLGFPGTSAVEAMDYIVVDPFIAGGALRDTATEKLAILPDCYQCNDRWEMPPAEPPSRSSCGLPEDGFVFCSFNQRQKITPDVFDQWMRILRQVQGSVLWLLKPPRDGTAANLCREAERRGVDPRRIVFADRVGNEQHIARNGVPDLHLDTFPYNAHTTASDALRAGCPILTRCGTSFPARVCGSLLTTIGVPELITYNPEEYEALAVRLARDKALLSGVRRRIEEGRARSPLFDVARYCRNIERAYQAMVELSRAGKPPQEIDVRALGSV
jgi:protein O-GlcNAc transferase